MSTTVTLTRTVTLHILECRGCGVSFAIPKTMFDTCQEKGGYWHCPNGHTWGWDKKDSQTEADKLRNQVVQLENAVRYERERLESQKRQTSAVKGQMTKLSKRVANGVCPCCNRSFQNLHRHIKTQHPTFTEDCE